jgi:hypothetical protein
MSEPRPALCFVVIRDVVHLRLAGVMAATLCGVSLRHVDFDTGGIWLDGAPDPSCDECIGLARAEGQPL